MKHQTSARWRISYWIIATVLLALLAVILTTRTFLFSRIEEDANATVEQEVSEFRAFVESGTDPQTAAPFTTAHDGGVSVPPDCVQQSGYFRHGGRSADPDGFIGQQWVACA